MIRSVLLGLDGVPTPVASFCATADERAEKVGLYRLDYFAPDGSSGRCWALAVGVQDYRVLQPCGGRHSWC